MSPFYSGLTCGIILGILGFGLVMFLQACLDAWCQRREDEQREDGESK